MFLRSELGKMQKIKNHFWVFKERTPQLKQSIKQIFKIYYSKSFRSMGPPYKVLKSIVHDFHVLDMKSAQRQHHVFPRKGITSYLFKAHLSIPTFFYYIKFTTLD